MICTALHHAFIFGAGVLTALITIAAAIMLTSIWSLDWKGIRAGKDDPQ